MTNKEIIASWRKRLEDIQTKHIVVAREAEISKTLFSQILSGNQDPKALAQVDKIEKIICGYEKKFVRKIAAEK